MKRWLKKIPIVLTLLFCIANIVGCSSSEEKDLLKKVEEKMESGDFDGAESLLNTSFEGKPAELKGALNSYNTAVTTFYNNYGVPILNDVVSAGYNTGFQDTYDSFENIDSIYKKYKPFKNRVDEWKDRLESAIDFENELRKDYTKMQEYLEKQDYEKCIEMSEEWNEKIEKEFPTDDDTISGLNEVIVDRLEAFTNNFSEENILYNSLADDDSTYEPKDTDEDSNYKIIEDEVIESTEEGYSDIVSDY